MTCYRTSSHTVFYRDVTITKSKFKVQNDYFGIFIFFKYWRIKRYSRASWIHETAAKRTESKEILWTIIRYRDKMAVNNRPRHFDKEENKNDLFWRRNGNLFLNSRWIIKRMINLDLKWCWMRESHYHSILKKQDNIH